MKKFLLSLLFSCSALLSMADCASSALHFLPNCDTLLQNPVLIIEGYGQSQQIITGLNKTHKVYLRSGTKIVRLRVKEINEGQFHLTQALLEPESPLEPGLEYTLCIDNLSDKDTPAKKYNSKTGKMADVKWTVSRYNQRQAPVWKKKPVFSKKSLVHFGCGPAQAVIFNCKVSDPDYALIRANITSIKTQKTVSYLISMSSDSTISIGHSMCSGAFVFDEEKYEVSFDLMDFSGNKTVSGTEKMAFTQPHNEDNEH